MKNFNNKNLVVLLGIIFASIVLYSFFGNVSSSDRSVIPYSEFAVKAESGLVKDIVIEDGYFRGHLTNGKVFKTYAINDPEIVKILKDNKVKITAVPSGNGPTFLSILISWFPFILLIAIYIFFMRQMGGGKGGAMGFGKSKARLLDKKKNKVTFKDVAGVDEAKQELTEIVDFLKKSRKISPFRCKNTNRCIVNGTSRYW